MNIDDLTVRQREVVEATEPFVLVLGGPGAGKTTTALWAAKVAVQGALASDQRVLFLTFSRTAVSQIARSAPEILGSTQGRIEIFTFHSLAWRLLRAFGRYGGHGVRPPELQSEARVKLLGRRHDLMVYDDLIPAARALLASHRIRDLVARRWPLLICDEFQDTGDEQWKLVQEVGAGARIVAMCDPNQMIYSFLRAQGVGPQRFALARSLAGRIVELEARSHRDPSGLIPAMAEAIRTRRFDDPAISAALESGRLTILSDIVDDDLASTVVDQVRQVRARGVKTVGVFGHSNVGAAELAAMLAEAKIDHALVGISEAHAEALITIARLCALGVGLAAMADIRLAFATFLTACSRGRGAPAMAVSLQTGVGLHPDIEAALDDLEQALVEAADGTLGDLVRVACNGWKALRILGGTRPWRRAVLDFVALARRSSTRPASQESVRPLLEVVERRHANPLLESDPTTSGPVQVMNFHQTKGREADAVILVYRAGDYLADRRDGEPFEEPSRVLLVALSRAKKEVVILLPSAPHELVAPLAGLGPN